MNPDSHTLIDEIYRNIEQTNENIKQAITPCLKQTGQTLESVAQTPLLQSTSQWIGLGWLLFILGEVDHQKIAETVNTLRKQYPYETAEQIAHRIIIQQGVEAAKIGLFTNFIPPFAIFLLGLEFSAITKLQVEMIYQIAAAHNLDLTDPIRRGENLAFYSLSLGGGMLKTGLNVIEIIPGIGAIVGASSDALLLYTLGQVVTWFYHEDEQSLT